MSTEITITVSGVKDEHIAYNSLLAMAVSDVFGLDGSGVSVDISVESNRDGVERVYEFLEFDLDEWRERSD